MNWLLYNEPIHLAKSPIHQTVEGTVTIDQIAK